MPKRLLALLVALLAALSLPAAASAATVPTIVAALKKRESYVEPALIKKIPAAKAERAAARHAGFKFVFLSTLPAGSKTVQRAAIRILTRYGKARTTVVVLWKGKLGVQTNVAAYKAKIANGTAQKAGVTLAANAAPVRAANAVSDALAGVPKAAVTPKPAATKKNGGSSWWKYLVAALFVLIVVGALILLRLRTREARKRRRSGSLSTARQFHLDRLEGLALRHAGLARAVADRPDDAELSAHHTEAGAKLTALRRTIPGLYSPRELRTSAGELDLAEWHLASAEARLASSEPPLRPVADQPALCFFSHELGLATNSIEVRKADGSVARVRVCAENHAALESGEDPIVSRVHVGGRLIPWPAAPTWYGAAGWAAGDLPGLEYEGREIWGAEAPRREPTDPRAISGLTPDEAVDDEASLTGLPEAEPTGAYAMPDAEEPEVTNPWLHDDVEGTGGAPLEPGTIDGLDEPAGATAIAASTGHSDLVAGHGDDAEIAEGLAPTDEGTDVPDGSSAGQPRDDEEFDELDDQTAPSFDWAAHMAGDQADRESGTGSHDRLPPDAGETTVQPATPWTFGDPTEVTDPFSPSHLEEGEPTEGASAPHAGSRALSEPPAPEEQPQLPSTPDAAAESAPRADDDPEAAAGLGAAVVADGSTPEGATEAADGSAGVPPEDSEDPWDERPQS